MKIDSVIRNAIKYFEELDDTILQEIALNSWEKDYGFKGTQEQAELFVKQSKNMISLAKDHTEINSVEMKKTLAVALFEYAKKLTDEISECHYSEMDKIRKLRDEKLNAEGKAILILNSLG